MQASRDYSHLLTDTHTYTATRNKYMLATIILIVVAFFIIAMILATKKGALPIGIGLIVFLLILLAITWKFLSKVREFTGHEGIVYTGWGYIVYSPWENVIKVMTMPRSGWQLQLRDAPEEMPIEQGIREHKPAMEIGSKTGKMMLWPRKSYSPYDYYHMIPLLDSNFFWQRSKVGQDILRYAPQVEDKGIKHSILS